MGAYGTYGMKETLGDYDIGKRVEESYEAWQKDMAERIANGSPVSFEDLEVLVDGNAADEPRKVSEDGFVDGMETLVEVDGAAFDVSWDRDVCTGAVVRYYAPHEAA